MSKKYEIIVNPVGVTEVGNLQFLSRLPGDGIISNDYIDTDEAGNEVYEIEVEDEYAGFVETSLNQASGVVKWSEHMQTLSEVNDFLTKRYPDAI